MQPIFLDFFPSKIGDFFQKKMRILWQDILFFLNLNFPILGENFAPTKKKKKLLPLPYTLSKKDLVISIPLLFARVMGILMKYYSNNWYIYVYWYEIFTKIVI